MTQGLVTCRTAEAAKKLGVSRQTLLRWFAERRITEVRRDHNNWRIFSDHDIERIMREIRGNDVAKQ